MTLTVARDTARKNGPAPEGRSQRNLHMLHKPELSEQQGIRDFVTEGTCTLSAVEMNRVLENCQYEHQRGISDTHVEVLADLMRRNRWQPKSQLDFAVVGGRYVLVNGYHRAYAQVRSGRKIVWNIALHHLNDAHELRALYHAFDTNIRPRTPQDIVRASEFAETNGMNLSLAKSLYSAAPFIASRFRMAFKDRDTFTYRQADRRLQIAAEYAKAGLRYAAAYEGVPAHRRPKLVAGNITAVAVVTFRYQSETAWEFWTGVAHMDGLKRGDPRLALATDFMSRFVPNRETRSYASFAPAIIAWNAFFNDRELKQIRLTDSFQPIIDGTPFDGKPVKVQ